MAQPGDPGTYIARDGHWYDQDGNDLGASAGQGPTPATPRHGGTSNSGAPGMGGGVGQPNTPPPSTGGDGTLAGFTLPPPNISLPNFQTPSAFAPTSAADLGTDPGYAFRVGEGERGLEASAAARGVLNSGGTLKDIVNYGQNAASQEFQNVDTRRRNDYQMNYQDQYVMPFQFGLQRAAQQGGFDFNTWLQQYNIFRNHQLDTVNANTATA